MFCFLCHVAKKKQKKPKSLFFNVFGNWFLIKRALWCCCSACVKTPRLERWLKLRRHSKIELILCMYGNFYYLLLWKEARQSQCEVSDQHPGEGVFSKQTSVLGFEEFLVFFGFLTNLCGTVRGSGGVLALSSSNDSQSVCLPRVFKVDRCDIVCHAL